MRRETEASAEGCLEGDKMACEKCDGLGFDLLHLKASGGPG